MSSDPLLRLCPALPPVCPASAYEEVNSIRNDFYLHTHTKTSRFVHVMCDIGYLGSEIVLFCLVNVSALFGVDGSHLILPLSGQHCLFQL